MKKLLKILGIFFAVILLFLLLAPLLFKGSLEDLLKKNINKNLNATVSWEEMDLSLFRSFPSAAVVVKDYSVVNNAPFEGDTLVSGKTIKLDMGITQLFKNSDDPIKVDALLLDEAKINIKVDSLGRANYDIGKKQEDANDPNSEENTEGFTFDLQKYAIKDSRISYLDQSSKTFLVVTNLDHEGKGDLSADVSELKTNTNALVSLRLDEVDYLKANAIALEADFQLDLKNKKYTFLENEAKINELPLTFDGFIASKEDGTQIDLTFKTPSSDFRNFLAVIPKVYTKDLDGVTTSGNFTVDGMLKGIANDTYIPKMDIMVNSQNASFKYPNLPKTVRNISIDAQLKNETGLAKDTYINIGGLTFTIDDEIFDASGSIRNITQNALVNMTMKGTLDLAKIEQVFPLEMEQNLSGVFKANVTTRFDMESIEKEQYQNIRTNGTASLKDFNYRDPAFKDEIKIQEAAVKMTPGAINLNKMEATTGDTDISATGNIQNLIPWVMAKQDLRGRFNVRSNTFNVNDFMTGNSQATAAGKKKIKAAQGDKDAVKIPDFLDATLDFNAQKVIYDNLTLEQTKGTVKIQDETATLSNVTSKALGGDVAFSGFVNTKAETPTFNMDLDLQKIDIEESFGQLALLKYIAPVAQALDGDLNTTLKLRGELNNDLTPNLQTLAGNALAQVLTAEVSKERTPLLSKLGEQLSFLNLEQLSLQNVSTALDFDNGNIVVKPFDFQLDEVKFTAGGSHGLDKSINYNVTMDVPAKLLGGEVNKLLSKLDPKEAENTRVEIPMGLKGSMNQPQISINTQAAVNTLTQRLIDKQKQELENKGLDILEGIIGGKDKKTTGKTDPKKGGKPKTETGAKDETTKVVKDILGGIFGKKKKKKDSTGN